MSKIFLKTRLYKRIGLALITPLCLSLSACLDDPGNDQSGGNSFGVPKVQSERTFPKGESGKTPNAHTLADSNTPPGNGQMEIGAVGPMQKSTKIDEVYSAIDEAAVSQAMYELENKIGVEKINALAQLGSYATGTGNRNRAIAGIEQATFDPDPDVQRIARGILRDLDHLREWEEMNLSGKDFQDNNHHELSPEMIAQPAFQFIDNPANMLPRYNIELRILYNHDENDRAAAIAQLALHPNEELVEILLQASGDALPENRRQLIQALGHAAVVGLNDNGRITTVLQDSLSDPDLKVAELAEKALDDLDTLAGQMANHIPIPGAYDTLPPQ